MDTIVNLLPFFCFFLSCIALGISLASLKNVNEELKILEEVMDYLEEVYDRELYKDRAEEEDSGGKTGMA